MDVVGSLLLLTACLARVLLIVAMAVKALVQRPDPLSPAARRTVSESRLCS